MELARATRANGYKRLNSDGRLDTPATAIIAGRESYSPGRGQAWGNAPTPVSWHLY